MQLRSFVSKFINRYLNPETEIGKIGIVTLLIGGSLTMCFVTLIGVVIVQDSVQPVEDSGIAEFTNKFGDLNRLYVEIADDDKEREIGLMNRTHLPAEQGMLFVYSDEAPRRFWMKNTLIPLDIIFLDKDGRVINFHSNTKTNQISETYPSTDPAQFVIETNGGWSDRNFLEVGSQFQLEY